MNAEEQINAHAYLYLTELAEPEDNVLRLVVTEGRVTEPRARPRLVGGPATDHRSIVVDDMSASYEIVFEQYIAYSVVNESFTVWNDNEKFEGRLFRRYSASEFLTYVRAATIASDDHPGPFTHYGVVCLNHIVEVASVSPPQITPIARRK